MIYNNKYKLIIPVALITLILSGCSWLFYDRFQVFDDEFKNSKKLIARFAINPVERRTDIYEANIIFERELTVREEVVRAYFVISRSSSSFKPESTGYLKIDDETYELNVDNVVTEQKMKTESSSTTYARSDSTGVSSGSSTDIDTRIWIDDKLIFKLTPAMISSISRANSLLFRFYFGPIPGTFNIRGSDLKLVKRTLQD